MHKPVLKFVVISYKFHICISPIACLFFSCTCLNQTCIRYDNCGKNKILSQIWSNLKYTWARSEADMIIPDFTWSNVDQIRSYLTLNDHTWTRIDHTWNYIMIPWADMIIPDHTTWSYLNQTGSDMIIHYLYWTRSGCTWQNMIIPGSKMLFKNSVSQNSNYRLINYGRIKIKIWQKKKQIYQSYLFALNLINLLLIFYSLKLRVDIV